MGFKQLIRKVRAYSGLSESESREALEMLTESLAVHLRESERKEFAELAT